MKKLIFAAAALALLLAGCGSESGYGQGTDFSGADGGEGAIRSSSTTAAPDIGAPPVTEPDSTSTTARPVTSTTAKPQAKGYEIKIQADQAGTQFEPRVAQVFAGTPITWTNTDSVPRSVEFSDGSYTSGPIAPGASVTFTASRAGEYNYSDGTRPYAVGTLKVQSR